MENEACSFDTAFTTAIAEIDDSAKEALDILNTKQSLRWELETNEGE